MGRKISLIGAGGKIVATEEVADDGTISFTVPEDPAIPSFVSDDPDRMTVRKWVGKR